MNARQVPFKASVRVLALAVALLLCSSVSSAFAESPWWQVSSNSAPWSLQRGGKAVITLAATNLGDAPVSGETSPVTIIDKLPPGLTAIAIRGEAGEPAPNTRGSQLRGPVECLLASLACVYASKLPPYERLWIEIEVEVSASIAPGVQNEVSITGGQAHGVTVKRPLSVGEDPNAFGVEDYELRPEEEGGALDTQAGSHPFQLTSTVVLKQSSDEPPYQAAQPKDFQFKLPPGLVGNPTPFPQCTMAQFTAKGSQGANACPPDSAIGVAMITGFDIAAIGGFTQPVPLFNLEPAVGEPARFGFKAEFDPVVLDTAVRTGGDYGVVVSTANITETAVFLAARVTFWGVPGDPRHNDARGWACLGEGFYEESFGPCVAPDAPKSPPPLLTLPTSCAAPFETSVIGDSWLQAGVFTSPVSYSLHDAQGTPLGIDGCNRLPFEPSISVAPDGTAGSTPTGLTVKVHVPQGVSQNGSALSEADVKDTTVALPAGVQLSPSAADGLLSCSLEQVSLETPADVSCPEASKVATVEIRSPLLPNPLEGAVYLAAQNANPFGSLVAMYLVAKDPVSGVLVKLAGKVVPDPVTGQLVSTFENTPQLPFEDLTIHFFGSARAPLSTPALCGSYTTQASITPWSGNSPATPSSTFQITSGPNGVPCSDPQPFAPGFQAGSTNLQAGAFTPFELTMSRPDADQTLSRVEMQMPPGLLGTLSSVKLCGEPQAAQGTCGEGSLIGHTVVSAGLGNDPYTVTGGKVFITTGYKGGAYGLSIVNPAKAGPFDLGNVIVRASINVDPHTAALTIKSDPLPTIIDGIPLQIQHVNVSVDRPGFTFNPTNCSKMAINGTLSSTGGASAAVSTPFQVTNCATLAFKPRLTASTSGKTSRSRGASLHVKLTYPSGPFDANIAKVKVDLPKQLPSRLTTLQKACTSVQFDANPAGCPAASLIGHAKAITPVIPVALEGPAYFVSHGGEAFPSLEIVLQGYGTSVDLVGSTFISKAGVTSSTFKSVPDVPVGTFELTLPQGKYSALAANGNLCKSKLAMPTAFLGQNGAEIHQSTPITVSGCAKTRKKAKQHKVTRTGSKTKAKG